MARFAAMNIERQAAIFGTIVAIVVCGVLVYFLRKLSNELALLPFLALCAIGFVAILGAAWLLDRPDAAQRARERSSPPSGE